MKALHIQVQGLVQGVGFRYSAMREAQRCGVAGWCRNRADGSVEIWVEGASNAVAQFLVWVHQGPPRSRVESVICKDALPTGLNGFDIFR